MHFRHVTAFFCGGVGVVEKVRSLSVPLFTMLRPSRLLISCWFRLATTGTDCPSVALPGLYFTTPLPLLQALALIELFNAPAGRYKADVYLLPKKMGT